MGTSFNQSQTTNNSKLPAMKKPTATGTMKTSAFLQRYNRSKNQNAQFWSDLTKLAEKAGKIESIDARRNPTNYNGPSTGLPSPAAAMPPLCPAGQSPLLPLWPLAAFL